MDIKLNWSPEAIEDIESIGEYIAEVSGFYARSVVKEILNVGNSIKSDPLVGRVVPELENENIRERFVYS